MSAARAQGGRTLGYRVLGPAFDYLLHLRPAEWPVMAAHTALGAVLAGAGDVLGLAVLGVTLWVVCLNGGTLAINSAFDRDEGDIAYLRSPPPPPRHLFAFGMGLMLAGGLAAAVLLPRAYTLVYAVCMAMSVAYSVPPLRLKAVAFADWAINMVGFGTLTPLAGWAATGRELTLPMALVFLAFCPLFAALYPLTQLYQADEDRARGDRTLALRLGMRRSLDVALGAMLLCFALLAAAAAQTGWGATEWRWLALVMALGGWLAVLLPWRRAAGAWAPAEHQRGMYRALAAWAVTDVAVALAWVGT